MCASVTTSLSSFERTSRPQEESSFSFFFTYRCELIHPTLGKGNAPGVCCQLLEPRVVVNDVFGRCWTASDDVLTG